MDVFDRHGLLVTRFIWEALPAEAEAAARMLARLKVIRDGFRPKDRCHMALVQRSQV
ncbi:MAG: hypothetical protein LBE08_10435 [Bifidobacteriaceae bacterium]|nr:hypothetical protein [Bifidobacteriaceae bacterium]